MVQIQPYSNMRTVQATAKATLYAQQICGILLDRKLCRPGKQWISEKKDKLNLRKEWTNLEYSELDI